MIPAALHPQVLKQLHEGHQGIKKHRKRAKQAVWWPGLSKQIKELVRDCSECYKHRLKRAEPLMPTSIPDLPWQKVGTDLFDEWKMSTYLLIIDYYSRWIRIAKLDQLSANTSSIFTRHGTLGVVISDNGPGSYAKFA